MSFDTYPSTAGTQRQQPWTGMLRTALTAVGMGQSGAPWCHCDQKQQPTMEEISR